MITYENVATTLIERVPEFEVVYREHLTNNFGEVLNHVLFGDLVRFTKEVYQSSVEATGQFLNPEDILKRILDFIEVAACSQDRKVTELVQVSFMENLHQLGPYYEAIRSQLGPTSRKLLEALP